MKEKIEDKIIEAFTNSEKSWDEYVDRFSGDIALTKDGYVEWLQRITIEDVPNKFIAEFQLEIFRGLISEFVNANFRVVGGTREAEIEIDDYNGSYNKEEKKLFDEVMEMV